MELMKKCRKLEEYAIFVGRVRERTTAGLSLKEAVDTVTDSCISENILKEFLVKHRGEVREMVLTTFDQESYERITQKVGEEAGFLKGEETGLLKGTISLVCKKLRRGKTPEQIADEMETDSDSLENIFRAATEFAPEYDAEEVYRKMCPYE